MTRSIPQSLILNVLQQVSPDRLQRAVTDLVKNTASITRTRTTETELRALVRTGEGHEYGVALTKTSVFCSCRDALYRGQVCKHATLLALMVLRTIPPTTEVPRTIHLLSREGVPLCGVLHPLHVWRWPYWPETAWPESCVQCEALRRLLD
jgi:hypothetical protein